MAKAIFIEISSQSQLDITVDSCGTASYHIGEQADIRVLTELKKNGVSLSHKARQLTLEDFEIFDYILGMDAENIRNINSIKPKSSKAKVVLFGQFGSDKNDLEIKDPYYGGSGGFARNYNQIVDCSRGLLKELSTLSI
jgi:low molecular weight phosphotyrosine protein phosphatase